MKKMILAIAPTLAIASLVVAGNTYHPPGGSATISAGSVGTTALANGAVTAPKIASGAAVSNIGAGGITSNELASNSVTSVKITDANVTAAKLASGAAVTNIGAGGITANELASNAVVNAKILNSTIDLTAKVTGALPVANGGTGSTTQNFVDLSTAQSIAGAKTFADLRLSGNGGAIQMLANNQYIGIANNSALPFRLLNIAATVEFMRAVSTTGSENLKFGVSLAYPTRAGAGGTTLTATDYYYAVTGTSGGTIAFPAVSGVTDGTKYVIKDEGGGAASSNIVLDPNSTELIDGTSTISISTNYGSKTVIKRNGAWWSL